MERGKSVRETQAQALREVIAQFDIETQVNKIAVRCFNDLLQSHRQAFQYMVQKDKKISEIEVRMTKAEGFAASIEANVNSKVQITNSLSRRLEVFNKEFFQSLKENQALIRTMRKDYDSLVSSTHKNTYQLRANNDEVKKINGKVVHMELVLEENLNRFTNQLGENTVDLQKQLIQVRGDVNRLLEGLTQAKSEFLTKGSYFDEISQDMQLYKHERESIERRLKDMIEELETKANRADVNEMRLFFDSQITTERERTLNRFRDLTESLSQEVKDRKSEDKKLNEESLKKWGIQFNTNTQIKSSIEKSRTDFQSKASDLQSSIQKLQKTSKDEITALNAKLDLSSEERKNEIAAVTHKVQINNASIDQLDKTIKSRSDEIMQLSSTVLSLNESLSRIIEENDNRKRQLQKMRTEVSQSNIGDEVSNMNGVVEHIREEILEHKRMTNQMRVTLEQLANNQKVTQNEVQSQGKKWRESLNAEKQQNQNRFVQINRRISEVSIEIMKSVQQAEAEAKDYTDQLRIDLKTKLEIMAQMKIEMQALKQAFKEQMAETEKLNRALTDKMERITTTMTKFKSDITIKVQGVVNQQQRRSLEIKQITKTLEDLRRHISNLTQGLTIALAMAISREVAEEGLNEPIKISSLIEGWVLEIEDKAAKYRGELIQRRKLLWVCLNFLSYQGDKVKGGVIQSGKDVYLRMMDEQQIFTARKRTMSKKFGSELPKLHL